MTFRIFLVVLLLSLGTFISGCSTSSSSTSTIVKKSYLSIEMGDADSVMLHTIDFKPDSQKIDPKEEPLAQALLDNKPPIFTYDESKKDSVAFRLCARFSSILKDAQYKLSSDGSETIDGLKLRKALALVFAHHHLDELGVPAVKAYNDALDEATKDCPDCNGDKKAAYNRADETFDKFLAAYRFATGSQKPDNVRF